jgi:hypothetical protein
MPVVGQGQQDGIEIASTYKFSIVEIDLAVAVLVCFVANSFGPIAMPFIDIAYRYHPHLPLG